MLIFKSNVMKKKNLILKTKFAVMSLLVILFLSCDGEDGATGPQGPPGQDGLNGIDGLDGNANVTSVLLENQSVAIGTNVLSIPELTQDIFDTGFVYGYATVNGNNYWEVFPITSGGSVILEIDRIAVGEITLLSTFNQGNLNFRFIFVASSSSSRTLNDLKKMSYQEAMEHFGLEY